jgi:hypothetical protein
MQSPEVILYPLICDPLIQTKPFKTKEFVQAKQSSFRD